MLPFLKQLWVLLGSYVNLLGIMITVAYPYSLLPGLRAADSPFKVDLETESWLATSMTITFAFGCLLTAFTMEVFGRRLTNGLFLLPNFLGWILIYYSADITTIMIGRFLGGLGIGNSLVLGAAITGEYSSPEYRGFFSALRIVTMCLGLMLTHLLAFYFNWRTIALIATIPQVISLCINLTWPESPSWLATKGRYQKSKESFVWLRGNDQKSLKEFEVMIQAQKERIRTKPKLILKEKVTSYFNKFTKKAIFKPVLISVLISFMAEVSARNLFPAFAMDMIGDINSDMKSNITMITIIIDVSTSLFSIIGCFLAKIIKRRTQLFASGISSLVVLSFFCGYLFLESREIISKSRSWIPVSLLILYFCLINLGAMPVYMNVFGEIFPLADKGSTIAVSSVIYSISFIFWFKVTPGLLVSLRVYGTFAVYGINLALMLICLYYILPETRNRTLQEIENYFVHGSFLNEDTNKANDDEEVIEMLPEK